MSHKNESLQTINPDLFSLVRRCINSLKEKEMSKRKNAIMELVRITKEEQLSSAIFEQITHMALKDLLHCFSDNSEYCRENAVIILSELLPRCTTIKSFLPYIFAVLVDRTNCSDLEGVANLPEKMRPSPGQKPKMLTKIIENCQQIRMLFCNLMKKILSLVQQQQIRNFLEDIVNIIRTLIMDPSSEVQKNACQTLEFFCKTFRMILLHFTEIMGRSVLLPLISKKSKIRIAGLNTLTAILWCGLWKYNAFVFQNLVGFRDPNSVPIKDFYQPSNNINYLATFINDPNVKVRQEFLRNIKIWICDLDDKYDHHGRIVPYMLSGLFDKDDVVRQIALDIIVNIGKQVQIEKQKQFRQSKQYAIDAKWTWEGKLVNLPVEPPLKSRPSLGSRAFVRGHVRKFWTALYKEIKDINIQNRQRSCYLMLYGTIFTQNYMTQYLDVMIPHLLTSIIAFDDDDKKTAQLIQKVMYYIGRYCEPQAYLHIIKSALKGQLIQNEQFVRSALKGLAKLIEGNLEAIPQETGLCHKKGQLNQIISLLGQCEISNQIYGENCKQGIQIVEVIMKAIKTKAKKQEIQQLMEIHCESLLKLLSVSYYESHYGQLIANKEVKGKYQELLRLFSIFYQIYPDYFNILEEWMKSIYMTPPSLMDADWKFIIVIHNFLSQREGKQQEIIFSLCQEVICQSLNTNKTVQILNFIYKYSIYLFEQVPNKQKLLPLVLVIQKSLDNLSFFKPQKKVPIYDQHLIKPETDPSIIVINEQIYLQLFKSCSEAIRSFYLNKVSFSIEDLSKIIYKYLKIVNKFARDKHISMQAIKTLWVIFERAEINEKLINNFIFEDHLKEKHPVIQTIVQFSIQRLQTLNQPDAQKTNMLFSILQRIFKAWPKILNASTKLPNIYPNYPEMLEKLFKYTMDEKDLDMKDKYRQLLMTLCSKLRPWFEFEARVSEEGNRFIRAKLLKEILSESK